MNYHAKFGGPSLKNDLSYAHFSVYSQVPRPLGATPLLKFFCQFLRGVNVNYHAKFGGPSLKNDLF